jgi:S1-C subfamily serine protease
VVISEDGLVVTNYHVISGESALSVRLASGSELPATEVVSSDPDVDVAIIQLHGKGFRHATFADSDALEIGQRIFVISNPLGLEGSVTDGIVSAVREIRGHKMLQITV